MVVILRMKPGETLEISGVILRNMGEGAAEIGLITPGRRATRYDADNVLVFEPIDGREPRDE